MFKGEIVINVWSMRAAVSKWFFSQVDGGYSLEQASNWQELEQEAIDAIDEQGGSVNISGQYRCPVELAEKAVF